MFKRILDLYFEKYILKQQDYEKFKKFIKLVKKIERK
jgi:hypothetical protein